MRCVRGWGSSWVRKKGRKKEAAGREEEKEGERRIWSRDPIATSGACLQGKREVEGHACEKKKTGEGGCKVQGVGKENCQGQD